MTSKEWWFVFFLALAILCVAFCVYEYRGVTDGKDGGTVSEWTKSHLHPVVIWGVLLLVFASLGDHFTRGKGKRWWWQRKREDQVPPA